MAHRELSDRLVRAVRAVALLVLTLAAVSCSEGLVPRASPIEATASRVLQTPRRFTTRLVTLRTESSTLVTTPDHPFAKVGAGWTPAANLAVGDRVHIRGSAEGTTVLELSVRKVPPTPVYNLTVDRTQTYFVGSEELLVHNINCFGRTGRQRDQPPETEASRRKSLAELLAEELKEERRQEREAKLAKPRKTNWFLDAESAFDPGRCTACTMASLGDFDSLMDFLDTHSDKRRSDGRSILAESLRGVYVNELIDMMKLVGLRSDTTPEPQTFPKPGTRVAQRSRFKYWVEVEKFMRTSTANTFAVTFQYTTRAGGDAHAVVGIRKDDGTIAFLDFSFEPPVVLDLKKLSISNVTVIPTDVDWHDNRHVNDLFKKNPKPTPPPENWLPPPTRWQRWRHARSSASG
jgi:hypothetical protein